MRRGRTPSSTMCCLPQANRSCSAMVSWSRGRKRPLPVRTECTCVVDGNGWRSTMQDIIRRQALTHAKPQRRTRARRDDAVLICAVPPSLLVLFVVVPLMAFVWRATADPAFWPSLTKPLVLDALWVTFLT